MLKNRIGNRFLIFFCSAKNLIDLWNRKWDLIRLRSLSHLRFMLDWLFAVTQIVAFFVIQNWLVFVSY